MIRSIAINIEDSVTVRHFSLEYVFQSVLAIAIGLSSVALMWSEAVQIVKDIVYLCKYNRVAFHKVARLTDQNSSISVEKEAILKMVLRVAHINGCEFTAEHLATILAWIYQNSRMIIDNQPESFETWLSRLEAEMRWLSRLV